MASQTWYTNRNDTKALTAILKDTAGTVINLTGATVVFTLKGPGGDSTLVKDRVSVTIVDAAAGSVSVPWTAVTKAGTYQGEFEVTYSDGTIETFPNPEKLSIVVTGDLDDQ